MLIEFKWRDVIYKELDILRREKKIGKNTEVGVWLWTEKPLRIEFLREITKTSYVFNFEGPEKLEVKILRYLGYKECPRCQKNHPATLNFDFLCNKCTEVLLAFPGHESYPFIVENLKSRGLREDRV